APHGTPARTSPGRRGGHATVPVFREGGSAREGIRAKEERDEGTQGPTAAARPVRGGRPAPGGAAGEGEGRGPGRQRRARAPDHGPPAARPPRFPPPPAPGAGAAP